MLLQRRNIFSFCLAFGWLILACRLVGLPGATVTPESSVLPSASPPPPATPTPNPTLIVLSPPAQAPTPEPNKYTIRKGDTLSDIAYSLGLKVEEIAAANPGLDAQFISPGQEIIIPSLKGGKIVQAQPTVMPIRLDPPLCYPSADGGFACIAAAHNDGGDSIEGLRAMFFLHAADGTTLQSIPAILPLERLGTGKTLPLSAFFPPPVNDAKGVSLDILNGLASRTQNERFADLFVQIGETRAVQGGLKATVRGQITVYGRNLEAGKVTLAATAYDKDGRAQGVRVWANPSPLSDGQAADFSITVYSLGGQIQNVDVQGEAKP